MIAHPAIGSINLLNYLSALQVLDTPGLMAAFDKNQLQQLAMQFLTAHKSGYLIAGAFFGFHCVILGYLLFKSELFPRLLGILMLAAAIGYLTESFGNFLLPEYSEFYSWIVAIPAIVAELSLCLWLLIKGVKNVGQIPAK